MIRINFKMFPSEFRYHFFEMFPSEFRYHFWSWIFENPKNTVSISFLQSVAPLNKKKRGDSRGQFIFTVPAETRWGFITRISPDLSHGVTIESKYQTGPMLRSRKKYMKMYLLWTCESRIPKQQRSSMVPRKYKNYCKFWRRRRFFWKTSENAVETMSEMEIICFLNIRDLRIFQPWLLKNSTWTLTVSFFECFFPQGIVFAKYHFSIQKMIPELWRYHF